MMHQFTEFSDDKIEQMYSELEKSRITILRRENGVDLSIAEIQVSDDDIRDVYHELMVAHNLVIGVIASGEVHDVDEHELLNAVKDIHIDCVIRCEARIRGIA